MTMTPELPSTVFAQYQDSFLIYRGSPEEMVATMAEEIGASSNRLAIARILMIITAHHRVVINLPQVTKDSELAASFVTALLDLGFVQPMAQA